MNLSIGKLLSTVIISVLTCLFIVLVITFIHTYQLRRMTSVISGTRAVLMKINDVLLLAVDNESTARGYTITYRNEYVESLKKTEIAIFLEADKLRKMLIDEPGQQWLIDSLTLLISKRVEFSKRMVAARQQRGLEATSELVFGGEGKRYSDQIRELGIMMQRRQQQLLDQRQASNNVTMERLNVLLYCVVGFQFILTWLLIARIRADVGKQKLNEEKFSALLDAAPDATVIVDNKGRMIMANKQAELLFGYAKSELIGQKIEMLVPPALRSKHEHNRSTFSSEERARPMGQG